MAVLQVIPELEREDVATRMIRDIGAGLERRRQQQRALVEAAIEIAPALGETELRVLEQRMAPVFSELGVPIEFLRRGARISPRQEALLGLPAGMPLPEARTLADIIGDIRAREIEAGRLGLEERRLGLEERKLEEMGREAERERAFRWQMLEKEAELNERLAQLRHEMDLKLAKARTAEDMEKIRLEYSLKERLAQRAFERERALIQEQARRQGVRPEALDRAKYQRDILNWQFLIETDPELARGAPHFTEKDVEILSRMRPDLSKEALRAYLLTVRERERALTEAEQKERAESLSAALRLYQAMGEKPSKVLEEEAKALAEELARGRRRRGATGEW